MPAPQNVVQAVQAGIVASAHLAAYEHVAAAAQACQRLGNLTSGRWRAAARELADLQDDLDSAYSSAAESLTSRADELGIGEDALWTVGDAAGTLDLLRERALDELTEEDDRAAGILEGNTVFGASFLQDPELPDRGTTLLFSWSDPLAPASWPWQANWVVGDTEDSDSDEAEAETEELDLFETGDMEGDESMLSELADELSCSRPEARRALRSAAMALTRASLLAGANAEQGEGDQEEYDEEYEEDEDSEA
jgi:hypothetical protein